MTEIATALEFETADDLEERGRFATKTPSARSVERAHAFHLLAGFVRWRGLAEAVKRRGEEALAEQMEDSAWTLVCETVPVRLSFAQEALDVSNPTVRAWAEVGILEDCGGSPKRVGLESVARVLEILIQLRATGQVRDLLAAVLNEIEREELLKDARFQQSLDEMLRGERAVA